MSSGARVSPAGFNIEFEQWSELAQRDPQAFFAARQALIDDFIASAPPQHREALTRLQVLIDGTRLEAGTPMNAVRRLMSLMGEHLAAMQAQLLLLREESEHLSRCMARLDD